MKTRMMRSLLMSLSLAALSCGKDVPPAPITGWVIGWTNDASYVPTAKILKTGDGGASWTLQTLPAGCAGFYGNDISAVSDQAAWAAVGDRLDSDGGILHTADGGASWALQALPDGVGNRHIKSIKGVSPAEAWAVSIRGDVLHTTDGGDHWTLLAVNAADGTAIPMQQVNRMDVAGRDIWIVDAQGGDLGVIHSPDGGTTWRQEQLPGVDVGKSPLSISALDSRVAWAGVNSEDYLWDTTDGGGSWSQSTDFISGTADFDDICASSASVVWIAQNSGAGGGLAARITVTNGRFESNFFKDSNYNMEGISARSDDQTAWLVGQKPLFSDAALPQGAIYFTRDGGVTWHQQTLPADALDVELWKVSFVGARR
jgi:photosystem II stability/assembly factor-like uncharacterized protein